jgi:glucosyl-dolichyl phosphate glucuronosyltransferase
MRREGTMHSMSPVSLSVVLCTYRRSSYLRKALSSLEEQSLDRAQFEVLVVDNACDQETRAITAEYSSRLPVVYIAEPRVGLTHARNAGAARARGKYVAFLDDDAVARPAWAESVITAFAETGPDVGMVGGPIELIWEAPRPAWLEDALLPPLGHLDCGSLRRQVGQDESIFGGNMAFVAVTLRAAGGFPPGLGREGDRRHLLSNEEVFIQRRLTSAGCRRLFEPGMLVGHHVPCDRLSPAWFRSRYYWEGVSHSLMTRRLDGVGGIRSLEKGLGEMKRLVRHPSGLAALARGSLPAREAQDVIGQCRTLRQLGQVRGWLWLNRAV